MTETTNADDPVDTDGPAAADTTASSEPGGPDDATDDADDDASTGGSDQADEQPEEPKTSARELDDDELTSLEDQRDFLLRSLADLEQEHAAGDVDEHDYVALRDDYTKRAARVIRLIEAKTVRTAKSTARPDRWRRIAVGAGVALFALFVGVVVAQTSGRREAGDLLTGDTARSTEQMLDEAVGLAAQGRYLDAIELQDEILDEEPDNVEAMTYKGWFQVLSGDRAEGLGTLTEAVQIDPEYPDVHAFLAVVLARFGRADLALEELDTLDRLNPPADIRQLTDGLRSELESSTTSSSTP